MSRGFRRFSKRHIATGVGLGFLAGAAVGTLAVVGPKSGDVSDAAIAAVGFAVVLSAVGMVVGGVIGAIHQTERWEAVPSSRWHVSSWQTGSGSLAFALSARF